jgi:hypothetical protein
MRDRYKQETKHPCAIRFVRAIIWLCCAGIIFVAADLQAAATDKNKEVKIEQLLNLIHISEIESEFDAITKKYTDEYSREISDYIKVNSPDVAGRKRKEVDRLVEAFWDDDVRKSISKVGTVHDYIKVAYSKSFSEDEVDRLILHYSSPLGEKDSRMKKNAAIEYNKIWTDQLMKQYKTRVELLFRAIGLFTKEKSKQGA